MVRFERIVFRQHPLIQKKKKQKKGKRKRKPYKSTSRLSPKQKNKNPKTQIVFLDQNSSSLRLAILRCTSIYTQIGLACSNPSNRRKIKPLQQWNPLFVLYNFERQFQVFWTRGVDVVQRCRDNRVCNWMGYLNWFPYSL